MCVIEVSFVYLYDCVFIDTINILIFVVVHFNTDLGRPARHMSGPAIELSEEGVCYRGVICIFI